MNKWLRKNKNSFKFLKKAVTYLTEDPWSFYGLYTEAFQHPVSVKFRTQVEWRWQRKSYFKVIQTWNSYGSRRLMLVTSSFRPAQDGLCSRSQPIKNLLTMDQIPKMRKRLLFPRHFGHFAEINFSEKFQANPNHPFLKVILRSNDELIRYFHKLWNYYFIFMKQFYSH